MFLTISMCYFLCYDLMPIEIVRNDTDNANCKTKMDLYNESYSGILERKERTLDKETISFL